VYTSDWEPFLRTAVDAIDRWARTLQGPGADSDEFGKYYDVRIRDDIHRKVDIKDSWVLRPATLHLGAHKVLQSPEFYRPGWNGDLDRIWRAVSSGRALHDTDIEERDLDFLIQVAWFRGEVLFP
jgi:hypothetical protein